VQQYVSQRSAICTDAAAMYFSSNRVARRSCHVSVCMSVRFVTRRLDLCRNEASRCSTFWCTSLQFVGGHPQVKLLQTCDPWGELSNCVAVVQGIVFDKFVEIDHDEVVMRKVHAISSKAGLRDVLERDNEVVVNEAQASICSQQFCLLPADLRDLGQARCLPCFLVFRSFWFVCPVSIHLLVTLQRGPAERESSWVLNSSHWHGDAWTWDPIASHDE
jgi:hypothetical protein